MRLQGCLGRVPRAERRVLVLRAGIGIARTRSRAQVARITGLRRTSVARLERRGLRRLRALARTGACAALAPAAISALPVSGPPPGGGGLVPRGQVLPEHRSGTSPSGPRTGGKNAHQSTELPLARPGGARAPQPGGSSFDLAFVYVPLALLVFALLLAREVRRTG
jgi:hypothetical protein